nr:reverse transcriptase domain-containing protein [Tanacetum cinerariifolium]
MLHMTDRSDGIMTGAFISGLRPGRFFKDLIARPPASMEDLFTQAHNFIITDEANMENRLRDSKWVTNDGTSKGGKNQNDWKQKAVRPKEAKEIFMTRMKWSPARHQLEAPLTDTDIAFSSEGLIPEHCNGKDPLVIKAYVGGCVIHRIYVGNGSSAKIMYEHCFQQLPDKIKASIQSPTSPLIGFTGQVLWPLGVITIIFTLCDCNGKGSKTITTDFMEDEEKAAFHTEHGIFCYENMPFGLKKAGATYQRLVDKAFSSQLGRNIKIYVDDMEAEANYPPLEKLALALVHTARRLPESPSESHPKISRKEMASSTQIPASSTQILKKTPLYTLYIDGASGSKGSAAGLILIDPDGKEITYALHFEFPASNNEAEYEALIAGLELAIKMEVRHLKVFSDSLLMTNHVKGTYEAREESMKRYLAIVLSLQEIFKSFSITQVPRSRNKRVPFDQRNNPPQHPRIVYSPILNINYFRHFLDILQNYDPMDDEPMCAADRVVALTPGFTITIPETANEFAIKGNHLILVKGNQFDGRTKTDPHKHIHEFLRIYDMFKYRDTKNEVVRLMMFPLSLTGEEKTWLDELNERTIETWDEIQTTFISRFFPPALFDQQLREIRAFSQLKNESQTDAWLRMKKLLSKLPCIDVIDEILEEDFDALLDEGSNILHSIEGTLLEEEIFTEFNEFIAMAEDENSKSESDTEEPPLKKSPSIPIIKSKHLLKNLIRILNSNHFLIIWNIEVDDNFPGETLMEINSKDEPWIADFANYLVANVIPKGMTYQQKNKFFSDLKHYFWEESFLFKVYSDEMIRRCVSGPETRTILEQCHQGLIGGHYGPNVTAKKVIDLGFYWPTIIKEAHTLV